MGKNLVFPAAEETEEQNSEIVKLPIEAIKPLTLPPAEPIRKIRNLMRTIEKSGTFTPVCVYRAPDGKYELLAGRHRLALAIRAGVKEIPAVVFRVVILSGLWRIHLSTVAVTAIKADL